MKKSTEFMNAYKALEYLCEAYKTDRGTENERAEQAAKIVCDLAATPEIRSLPQRGSGVIVLYETESMMHTLGIYLTGDGAVDVSCGMGPGGSPAHIRNVERMTLEALFRNEKGAAESLKGKLARRFP